MNSNKSVGKNLVTRKSHPQLYNFPTLLRSSTTHKWLKTSVLVLLNFFLIAYYKYYLPLAKPLNVYNSWRVTLRNNHFSPLICNSSFISFGVKNWTHWPIKYESCSRSPEDEPSVVEGVRFSRPGNWVKWTNDRLQSSWPFETVSMSYLWENVHTKVWSPSTRDLRVSGLDPVIPMPVVFKKVQKKRYSR